VKEILPFIIAGIATGSIYGLAGTGLVLTYKTSGIFNFGYGALATAAAYLFYFLHYDHGLDWKLSFVVSVFVAGPLLGLLMEVIAKKLSRQNTAAKIVGTVGLILVVQGLGTILYGGDTIRVPQYLPKGTETFRVGGVNVQYAQLTVAIVAVVAAALLYALFRWTRQGVAMRAVVDDPDLLAMRATSPTAVRRVSWIIGCTFAALSGVLVLPFIGLNAVSLTFLVVQAFGAAAVGAFASIPLTFLGGVAIGIVAALSKKYVLDVTWLSGLPDSLPFIVLIGAMLILPRRKLVPPSSQERRPPLQYHAPGRVRAVTAVIVLIPLVLIPHIVDGTKLGFFTIALAQAILILSLGLLVRTSGQVSLCHATFAAIGATAFSQLAVDHGVPWLLAVFLGALIVVPVGALVAIPAIRLSGLFLALATFGFGIMVQQLFYARGFVFTVLQSGRAMPRPSFGDSDTSFYYVVLTFFVVIALVMAAIEHSRFGRVLRGMSNSPVAVATMGLSTNTTRVIVFCISAFIAGVSGILYGSSIHFAVSSDAHFVPLFSLIVLAQLAVAPFAMPWYALPGMIGAVLPAYLTGDNTTDWLNVLFGFFAVMVSMEGLPVMSAKLRAFLERFRRRIETTPAPSVSTPVPVQASTPDGQAPGLVVANLGVRFGGLVAVDDLSFTVPLHRITGLIGPNGAGKTTTFDAISGLNRRIRGQIRLHGEDMTRVGPAGRARRGLGRTFQRVQLGESLSVAENVALGREASMAGGNVLTQLGASPSDVKVTSAAASAAMEMCGISHLAGTQAGALTTGQRRLVELARCLAGPFDVLLLDEPSSGLDQEETAAFDDVLRRVVAERGCGVLLVEHDMALVMNLCNYIYVLDFGRLIFEGDSAAVASSPVVQAAYLGSDSVAPLDEQEATL
jgi:ABC-type branched-subunit amino acid transport system ATPase component/branched-subunit amino acid ABC-type transport system permease component